MKNKRSLGLVTILMIVVVVLIVSGVAYYMRKSSIFIPQNQGNNYQPTINQNSTTNTPVINSNTNTQKNITPAPKQIATLILTSKNNGKTFTVTKEQMITVTLCNPGDGGYQFDTPKYDSSVLLLTNHTNIPINNPTGYVGGCYGNDVFKFQVLNTGSSKLVITASRGTTDTINIFSASIVIQNVQGGIKPNTCKPIWKCDGWSLCNNGSQSMIPVDSNNCGISYQGSPVIACPALARLCN